MKSEAKVRVYDVLARAFTQEGVRTCFALLGDANMNWAARLAEQGCRMIYVRSMSGTSTAPSRPPWRTLERARTWVWRP
jgi:hypothetical protein